MSSSSGGSGKRKSGASSGAISVDGAAVATRKARQRATEARAQYVRLDKKKCAQKLVLSNGDLTVAGYKGYRQVRATHGPQPGSGAWYFEVEVDGENGGRRAGGGNDSDSSGGGGGNSGSRNVSRGIGSDGRAGAHARIGWATFKANLEAPVGYDQNSYSYRDVDGAKVHRSFRLEFAEPFGPGDVIGCYICLPNAEQASAIAEAEDVGGEERGDAMEVDSGASAASTAASAAAAAAASEGATTTTATATTTTTTQPPSGTTAASNGLLSDGLISLKSQGPRSHPRSEIRFFKNGRPMLGPATMTALEAITLLERLDAQEKRRKDEAEEQKQREMASSSSSSSSSKLAVGSAVEEDRGGSSVVLHPSSSSSSSSSSAASTFAGLSSAVDNAVATARARARFVAGDGDRGQPEGDAMQGRGGLVRYAFENLVSEGASPQGGVFFPAISLYGNCTVTFNAGPAFAFAPRGIAGPDGMGLSQKRGGGGGEGGASFDEEEGVKAAVQVPQDDVRAKLVPCRPISWLASN